VGCGRHLQSSLEDFQLLISFSRGGLVRVWKKFSVLEVNLTLVCDEIAVS
jgi:hypothetical protein